MKTRFIIALIGCWFVGAGSLFAADALSDALQKGLLEEEANRNLPAALESYQKAVAQFDKDRQVAATAVFRLAECYRKLGRTNEANVQYQRIVREFSDQSPLVKLSRDYLGAAGVAAAQPASTSETVAGTDEEAVEIQRIKNLIKNSPDLINARSGENDETPLHGAAAKGQLVVATFLLDNGADVNVRSARGYTPLHQAAINGQMTMVEFLLQRGASVNARVNSNQVPGDSTPLHLATRKGYRAVAEVLLQKGAELDAVERGGLSAVHYAVINSDLPMLELLLRFKPDVNIQVSVEGSAQIYLHLLDSLLQYTPLHVAALRGDVSAAKALVAAGAKVDARDARNKTPLHLAASAKQVGVLSFLLEQGANANAADEQLKTPLFNAVFEGGEAAVTRLLDAGADANAADKHTVTPLLVAMANGSHAIISRLLSAGARPNQKGSTMLITPDRHFQLAASLTPLQNAVNLGDAVMVELLLKAGADLSIPYEEGWSVLYGAVARKNLTVAQLLLVHKADVSATDKNGNSMLHIAVRNRDKAMLELLLKHKADPNVQANDSTTPLSLARPVRVSTRPSSPAVPAAPGVAPRALRLSPGASSTISPDEAKTLLEMADLLVQYGADEFLQRRSLIGVSRTSQEYQDNIFYQDKSGRNRYTLIELLAQMYGEADNNQFMPRSTLPFPDFKRVTINRFEGKQVRYIKVDVAAILESSDASKDVWLKWGDIVEIPEADHPLKETWTGLARPQRESLQKLLSRTVTLMVKGEKQPIVVQPFVITWAGGDSQARMVSAKKIPMDLKSVVYASNRLLVSSDLSKVKVTRAVPGSDSKEFVYDLASTDRTEDFLWLRDGDVIEVPEK